MDILFRFWDEQLQLSLPRLHAHFGEVGMMPQVRLRAFSLEFSLGFSLEFSVGFSLEFSLRVSAVVCIARPF